MNQLMQLGLPGMLIVMLSLGVTPSVDGQALREVTYLWPSPAPNPAVPEVYIAQALGYFQEEGLRVTVVHLGGSGDALKFVTLGRGEFAVGPPDGLILSAQSGNPLKSVCTFFYSYAFELLVLADSSVKSVKDLMGKKIGVTSPGSGAIPYVHAVFRELGLPSSNVQFMYVGTQMSAFLALTRKEVDALASTGNTTALFGIEGVPVRRLETAFSKKLEGGVIAVRSETIASSPVVVVGVLRALAKAEHYYLSNPRAGVLAMSKVVPDVARDLERSIKQGALSRASHALPQDAGGLYCWTSMSRWEAMQNVMLAAGYVTKKLDPSTYFTTQFLLEVNKFDRVKIKQEAQRMK